MTPTEFRSFLDGLPYDKYCQDIEYIELIGNTKSFQTWKILKDFLPWQEKCVADLGCFHGYYCFKLEQIGAIVTGFDKASIVLHTTELLRDAYKSKVRFFKWEAGEVISGYDVALMMLLTYNLPDPEKALKNILCRYVIFDIAYFELPLIRKYYNIRNITKLSRVTKEGEWCLVLGERKDYVSK